MKSWKKVASMLLAATMLTPFAACGDKGGDSTPDDSTPTGDLVASEAAKKYVQAVNSTLESTKSLKITAGIQGVATTMDMNRQVEGVENIDMSAEIVISEDANGAYALSLKAEMTEGDVEEENETRVAEAILGGQYLYTRTYEADGTALPLWTKQDIGMPVDVEEIVETQMGIAWENIEAILGTKEVVDFQNAMDEAFAFSIEEIINTGKVENGTLSMEVDFASFIMDWVNYIEAIDGNKTLETFVNETAAKAGLPITYATLVNDASTFVSKTAADAVQILDDFAKTNFGKSLEEVKNEFAETEFLAAVMKAAGLSDQEIAANVATIKATTIESLKTQYQLDQITMKDLINSVIASASAQPEPANEEVEAPAEPVDYVGQILTNLTQMKDVPISELGIANVEVPITLKELKVGGALSFNADNTALTGISYSAKVDMDVDIFEVIGNGDQSVQQHTGIGNAVISMNVSIAQFSTSIVSINVPAENEIASDVVEGGETGDKIVQE